MATIGARLERLPTWIGWVVPLVIIAALVVVFLLVSPIGELRDIPPTEAIAIERTVFNDDEIVLHVRNDGPDPVTIAQVLVDDAYRPFAIGEGTLNRLESTAITIPYHWEEGLPLRIGLLTQTGVVIAHDIEAAALTPEAESETLVTYGMLGVYIGLLPVVIGLLWYPALRRTSPKWIAFYLAVTVGLLVFLLVDTAAEGLELAAETGGALNGLGLLTIGAVAAFAGLVALGNAVASARKTKQLSGLPLSYFIATGIGLHNMGEGLAVGAALAAGEVALGTFLVLGFMLHNTTEGLAIVSPLGAGKRRPSFKHFILLGIVAGAPTIPGAWAGGFAFAPSWAALAFGVAAGAIAQVIWAVGATMPQSYRLSSPVGATGLVAGIVVMYVTGLLVA